MCLTIRKIGLGDDVQALWNFKKAEGYSYQKLPDNKLFFNFFRLSKDNENVIIGSNKKNEVSMFVYSESIPSANINDIYVKYLEFLFKNRYSPMPDHLKKSFPVNDDFQLFNGAMSSNGDFVLLGKSKDTHDVNRDIWMSIVGSPSRMGQRIPDRTRHSRTASGEDSRSLDIWDVIGTAGTVAGIFSLF